MKNPFSKKKQAQFTQTPTEADDDSLDTGSKSSRGQWGRQIDFMLSCIGFAVGLGNLWRFPYLCMKNGGGAFLIPYFLFLFLCGMPLFFLELVIGQFSSRSALCVWSICPLFKGLGIGATLVSAIVGSYYNVIITWVLYYLGHSFQQTLPWSNCNNPWNTPYCALSRNDQGNGTNATTEVLFANATTEAPYFSQDRLNRSLNTTEILMRMRRRTPSEEFWQFQMLEMSRGIEDPGGFRWEMILCLAASWIVIVLCLSQGIKTSGKVVYVTATVPYIFLTILLIRGCMLPGAIDGIKFYLIPDWKKLLEFNVWAEGCLQIFYTLGPAWGGLITMASYNKFNNNCLRDAIIVPVITCATSFYAGFVIFSVIGFMAREAGLSVKDVITSGPGLAFIAYPEALTRLPFAPFWAVCFFLMVLTVGLDSQFCMIETVCSGIVDCFPKHLNSRKFLVTIIVCSCCFLLSLPYVTRGGIYVFQIVDWYSAMFSVTVIALLECICLGYCYGWKRLYYDIETMIGYRPSIWWAICWCGITPILTFIMLIFSFLYLENPTYGDYHYPQWSIAVGFCLAMVSLLPIPINMVWVLANTPGTIVQRIKRSLQPTEDWGPALAKHRLGYKYARQDQLVMEITNGPSVPGVDDKLASSEKSCMLSTQDKV